MTLRGGRIAAIEDLPPGRAPRRVLLPGLVDAHAHVQLPPLPAAAPLRGDFMAWVRAVLACTRAADHDAVARRAAAANLRALRRSGCTAVAEIDGTGQAPALLAAHGFAGRAYRELFGFHLGAAAARGLLATLSRETATAAGVAAGWSPHAPYSCSPHLLRAAASAGRPLSIHVAEVPEEGELLRTGRGPLRQLLEELGRFPPRFRPPGCSAVRHLDRLGLLGPRTLAVHAQEAGRDDVALLAARRTPVVVCPGTIAFFGRRPPDVPGWLRLGVRVVLGTDSRASSPGALSMRREMARARRAWPQLDPHRVLAMASSDAARAIGRPSLGRIRVGGRADLCLVALARGERPDDAVEAFTAGERAPLRVLTAGAGSS